MALALVALLHRATTTMSVTLAHTKDVGFPPRRILFGSGTADPNTSNTANMSYPNTSNTANMSDRNYSTSQTACTSMPCVNGGSCHDRVVVRLAFSAC